VVDDTNDEIYVFYDQHVYDPYGSIYMKKSAADHLLFNATDPGTLVLQSYSANDVVDPQGPAHGVTADMDGRFYLFGQNEDGPQTWYTYFDVNKTGVA